MASLQSMGQPLRWDAETLWQQLEPLLPGLTVEVLAEVGSTSTLLLERARLSGDNTPCLLVAERQTAGRGRQGKGWQSVLGATLTFSLALPLAPADWSGLSLAVGLALAEALEPSLGGNPSPQPRLVLKWPNDVLLRDDDSGLGRKLGGILIETVQTGGRRMVVIGMGLNVQPLPDENPGGATPSGWGRAWLQELDPTLDAPAVLARVSRPLVQALLDFERQGFAPLQARYATRDLLAGLPVTTTLAELPSGVADGVDHDGALWLRAGGQRHRVTSGEVSIRPAAMPAAVPTATTPPPETPR